VRVESSLAAPQVMWIATKSRNIAEPSRVPACAR
jgi:hypothetical protein